MKHFSFLGLFRFPRLSILYKKCDEYTFDLTPFDPYSMFGIAEKCSYFPLVFHEFSSWIFCHLDVGNGKKKMSNAAKGKAFKVEYNLLSYKLIFQLALKEDNVIFISHTTCETEPIDESMFQ